MAIQIARVQHEGKVFWARIFGPRIARIEGDYPTTGDFIERGLNQARDLLAKQADLALDAVTLLSPITANQQLICQATNFRSHLREIGRDPEQHQLNVFFRKASSALCGANDPVLRPQRVKLLDYELELGLVIGTAISGPTKISDERLADFVVGLTIVNDISARNIQIPEQQFFKAKSFRSFAPVGPYLVLLERSEFSRIDDLQFELKVDGTPRQQAQLGGDMVFSPAQTLSELSTVMDLRPGDLIATGTPGGVALQVPPRWLQWVAGLLSPARRFELFVKGQLKTERYLQPGQLMTAAIRTSDGAIDLGRQTSRIEAAEPTG